MKKGEFETFRESKKKELLILTHLLLDLLGVDNRLRYEKASDRILKKDYKSFLESIRTAIDALLQDYKSEIIDTNNPMTRQRVAFNLQSSTEGTQTMTSREHTAIMRTEIENLWRDFSKRKICEGTT